MASPSPVAMEPPPGGDQSRGRQLLVVQSILLSISAILVFARLYTRIFLVKKIGLDDYSIVGALVSIFVSLIIDSYQVRDGWGRHTYYLLQNPESRARLTEATKLSTMNQINTILALLLIKFSIGVFLQRVFGTKKAWRWTIFSIIAFVFITTVISVVMTLVQCRPLYKLWDHAAKGTCWSPQVDINIGYYNAAVAVITDWALSSLPIAIMWNLQMSLQRKSGIVVLMGVGYFSGVCAIIRAVNLKNLAADDISWAIIPTDIWAGTETRLGIIAACIPTIRPLFSSSLSLSIQGWSRIFGSDSAAPKETHTKGIHKSFHKGPVRRLDSISEALRTQEQDHIDSHQTSSQHTGSAVDDGMIPRNGIKVDKSFLMEDLETSGERGFENTTADSMISKQCRAVEHV